jgi:hypothetical protein
VALIHDSSAELDEATLEVVSERSVARFLTILTLAGFLTVAGLTVLRATNRAASAHPATTIPSTEPAPSGVASR